MEMGNREMVKRSHRALFHLPSSVYHRVRGLMNPIPAAGLLIGVLCGMWTFVMGFTGWYKDPSKAAAFFVVIVIEVAGLIWGLRQTASAGADLQRSGRRRHA